MLVVNGPNKKLLITSLVFLIIIGVILAVITAINFTNQDNSGTEKWSDCDGSKMPTQDLVQCIEEKYPNKEEQITIYDQQIARAKRVNDEAEIVALIDRKVSVIKELKGCDAIPSAYKEEAEGLDPNTIKVVYRNAAMASGECDNSESAQAFIELSNKVEDANEGSY